MSGSRTLRIRAIGIAGIRRAGSGLAKRDREFDMQPCNRAMGSRPCVRRRGRLAVVDLHTVIDSIRFRSI